MGKLHGSSTETIEAAFDDVWRIVEDVLDAPNWQGGLDGLEPLERDDQGRPTLCETMADLKVTKIKTLIRFDYSGAPNRLGWVQEKGDLKEVEGAWELKDLGDGKTQGTYLLDVDFGRALGLLIRGPVEGQVRKLLVESRAGELKSRVEGS